VLKHLEKRRQKNEEEGFTLIELMVVVLIMGILMAIAIPTFLSTRGSANDASAKSNATNAFTNEKSYYSSNVAFITASGSEDNGPSLDSTLPWGTPSSTNGTVAAYAFADPTSGTTDNAVVIEASSQSGHCFYIADVEGASSSTVAYAATASTCVSGTTAEGLVPTSSPAVNSTSGIQSGALTSSTTWDASW
jgi:type IV pilus assembly protein PilA